MQEQIVKFEELKDIKNYPIIIFDGDLSPVSENQLFLSEFGSFENIKDNVLKLVSSNNSKKMFQYENKIFEILFIHFNSKIITVFKNITTEIQTLSKIKNMEKKINSEKNQLIEILNKLPFGVILIDNEYNIIYNNPIVYSLFHFPKRASLDKCYYLFKSFKPCGRCKLQNLLNDKKLLNKKENYIRETHEMTEDNFLTSTYYKLSENRALIIFENTTKEILLLKRIKSQQQKIQTQSNVLEKQNDILHSLSIVNIEIASSNDFDRILDILATSLTRIFDSPKIAIVLYNYRNNIENVVFKNVSEDEQKIFLSKELIEGKLVLNDEYNEIPLSTEEREIGKIYMKTDKDSETFKEILPIFTKQITTIVENKILQKKLEEIAHTDGLTKLFNRYYYDKIFEEEKEKSDKFSYPLGLIMIDINGLKKINDDFGHQAGDLYIKSSADEIKKVLRQSDYLFRYGGDEIVILIPNCSKEDMKIIEERLTNAQKNAKYILEEKEMPIRYSLGSATTEEVRPDKLLMIADERMYKNKVEFYKTHKKYR